MEAQRAVVNPNSGPLMLNHSPMMFLLDPPLSPGGLPITPTWGPRPLYTGGGRPQQAPAVVSHVQQDEPRPTEEELQVETPAAKNFAGDV